MYVIRRCRHHGVETSICGQAGSKEEMARFLVGQGIDSISVNADAAKKVSELVREEERKMAEEAASEKEKPVVRKEFAEDDGFGGKKKKRRRRNRRKNRGQQFGAVQGESSQGKENSVSESPPTVEQQASPQEGDNYEGAVVSALEGNDEGAAEVVAQQEISKPEVADVPELNNAIPVGSDDTISEEKDEVIELVDNEAEKRLKRESSGDYVELSHDQKEGVKSMFDDSDPGPDEVTNLF
jgi:hypothetical protein